LLTKSLILLKVVLGYKPRGKICLRIVISYYCFCKRRVFSALSNLGGHRATDRLISVVFLVVATMRNCYLKH
jgi:hypothetical protein